MNTSMATPRIAHTQHDYARMLAARAEPGDAGRALELVGRALDGYRSLGMDGFAAEAAELGAEPSPLPARSGARQPAFTGRETERLPAAYTLIRPSRIGWLKTKERR